MGFNTNQVIQLYPRNNAFIPNSNYSAVGVGCPIDVRGYESYTLTITKSDDCDISWCIVGSNDPEMAVNGTADIAKWTAFAPDDAAPKTFPVAFYRMSDSLLTSAAFPDQYTSDSSRPKIEVFEVNIAGVAFLNVYATTVVDGSFEALFKAQR